MTDDLIKRLREQVPQGTPLPVCHMLDEAADRIEALTAENERLRAALGELSGNTGKLASRENENG